MPKHVRARGSVEVNSIDSNRIRNLVKLSNMFCAGRHLIQMGLSTLEIYPESYHINT